MKPHFLFAVVLAFTVLRAAAQGTVNFANGAAGVDAPVILAEDGLPAEGPRWQAELLLVSTDGSMKRIGNPVSLQSAASAGYFLGGSMTVSGVEIGASATFRVRAFDTAGSADRISNPVTVTLGGGIIPPPNLVGLENWAVKVAIPELKIAFSQKSVTLSWSKDFPTAALEFTDSLTSPNWRPATETPLIDGSTFAVTVPMAVSERYYRLRVN